MIFKLIFRLRHVLILPLTLLVNILCLPNTFAVKPAAQMLQNTCRSYFIQNDILNECTAEEKKNLESAADRISDLIGRTDPEYLQVKENIDRSLVQFISKKQWSKEQIFELSNWFKERIRFYINLKRSSAILTTAEKQNAADILSKQKETIQVELEKIKNLMQKYKATNLTQALISAQKIFTPTRQDDILSILDRFEHLEVSNEAFQVVVRYYHLEAIDYFIKNGVNVNFAGSTGKSSTALHLAAQFCPNAEILEKLLIAGADPYIRNESEQIPLHLASQQSWVSVEAVELLLKFGNLFQINAKDMNGDTPLHFAVKMGNTKVVELLLKSGASTSLSNNLGFTALHVAAKSQTSFLNHFQLQNSISILIQADHGAQLNSRDRSGKTPLHFAIYNSIDIVEKLLEAGADPTLQNNDNQTPYDVIKALNAEEMKKISSRVEKLNTLRRAIKKWNKEHPP